MRSALSISPGLQLPIAGAALQPILIVCTGNICRSPMAEGLLRYRLAARPGVSVASAGVGALVAHPADPYAVEVMRQRGIDISGHRGRQIDHAALVDHGLVLVMERAHLEWISLRFPMARGRVFLLGHWQGGKEVPDPYQQTRQAFENVLGYLEAYAEDWLKRIDILVQPQ
jgi:protein-tyrosine phosphatase